ncbi:MAG: M16 family metallopeptidase, partial [Polyangiales bacterium]
GAAIGPNAEESLLLAGGLPWTRAAAAPTAASPAAVTTSLAKLPIERVRLDNGLRVVLSPNRTVPTVAIAVYYDVGSRNEVKGRSGFAHLFEHMMFQGSDNVGKGDHFNLIMHRGGTLNGTTSTDRTNYFETLPAGELALGLWLEADRMRSLSVTAENFENQRQTVMEERRQSYDNQPYMQSMLRINELAYGDYWPYAHSTIGDMRDLKRAPLSAVQAFFRQYYLPNNAVLSIAGDFEPQAAMALVKRYFGAIAPGKVPLFDVADPAPQRREKVASMRDPIAELPAFHMAYHIPRSRHRDHYALELLAMILGDGESSRLYQDLVKKREICQEISVGTDDRRGPDLFSVWAILASGKSVKDARQRVDASIRNVQEQGVSARELEKAKNRVRAAFIFGLQSNLSRAMQLAEFELYWQDARLLREEVKYYMQVSATDVQRVAKRYLKVENRTVLDVLPAKGGARSKGRN